MKKQGYLDIHTHVLPGVDDGAQDMQMTESMLRKAYEEGVRSLVATSHSYPDRKGVPAERVRELTNDLQRIAKSIAPDYKVYTGQEIFYRSNIVEQLQNGELLTIADTNYVLVEFHPKQSYKTIRSAIDDLIQYGYYPIIAHVERVEALMSNTSYINELIELSCYLQVNTGSLMGGMFDKRAKVLRGLIKEGKIHFLGSDCHNMDTRPPRMKDCVNKLYKKLPREVVDRVVYYNQARLLENQFL